MPTTRALPNRRAWSMAPAWPNSYSSLQLAGCYQLRSQWVLFTVVAKVKAPVNPNAILRDGNIFLRIHWPLARQGNLLVERCCIHWGFLDLKECLERRKKQTGNLGNWNYYMEWKSGGLTIRRGWGTFRDYFLPRLLLLLRRGSVLS